MADDLPRRPHEDRAVSALRPDWLERPRPDRLDPDHPDFGACLEAHRSAVAAGRPGYLDRRSGLYVMTAVYLRDRGWCCDRGCRHCPYQTSATDRERERETDE